MPTLISVLVLTLALIHSAIHFEVVSWGYVASDW